MFEISSPSIDEQRAWLHRRECSKPDSHNIFQCQFGLSSVSNTYSSFQLTLQRYLIHTPKPLPVLGQFDERGLAAALEDVECSWDSWDSDSVPVDGVASITEYLSILQSSRQLQSMTRGATAPSHGYSPSSTISSTPAVSKPALGSDMAAQVKVPNPVKYAPSDSRVRTVNTTKSEQKDKPNPFRSAKEQLIEEGGSVTSHATSSSSSLTQRNQCNSSQGSSSQKKSDPNLPPALAIFDPELLEKIEADIIHNGSPITFEDIAGLEFAKKCVNELICWPMSRPDLFQGLRSLPRGVLLFGPPGTGKTLIGKAIAFQVGATFFNISASSLTSKWIGEGEKTVRALFALAAHRQPSVVFIDEVDSLLCQRSSEENEASRRIKTEFLVQLDGAGTSQDSRVVIVGATNRPEELDEAARRRFVKRIYIPLPDDAGRRQLFQRLLSSTSAAPSAPVHSLSERDIENLVASTEGFSGADIRSLCTEAAMCPVRELAARHGDLQTIRACDVPRITSAHFNDALDAVAPSVSPHDLLRYVEWNGSFGSFRKMA